MTQNKMVMGLYSKLMQHEINGNNCVKVVFKGAREILYPLKVCSFGRITEKHLRLEGGHP